MLNGGMTEWNGMERNGKEVMQYHHHPLLVLSIEDLRVLSLSFCRLGSDTDDIYQSISIFLSPRLLWLVLCLMHYCWCRGARYTVLLTYLLSDIRTCMAISMPLYVIYMEVQFIVPSSIEQ
jgi:hypothetical protein